MQTFTADFLKETLFPHADERKKIDHVLNDVTKAHGRIYVVGGAVRDLFIGRTTKDVDLEVHGLPLEALENILRSFGVVNTIGKFFGVLRWEYSRIEWAVPRKDESGRKPNVTLNPTLDITTALKRRDLTVNAMALDLATGEFIDPFGGYKDLKEKTARTPDAYFFTQDPLRFYRVMQFIARFNLTPDDELNRVCATMSIKDISQERIEAEFDKLFLLSDEPSRGIRWIESLGRLSEVLPELGATVGILQEKSWHPEGDVFEHTMQVIDAAATYLLPDDFQKVTLLSAALCHDLGKAVSTRVLDGRIRSIGHEITGVPLAKSLLKRITGNKKRIAVVTKLVRYHMDPGSFIKGNASLAAYKRLSIKLFPETNCAFLALLAQSDRRGRNPLRGVPLEDQASEITQFEEMASKAGVLFAPVPPILQGADLMNFIEPGPSLGAALKKAYELQINEDIEDKEVLKKRILKELRIKT